MSTAEVTDLTLVPTDHAGALRRETVHVMTPDGLMAAMKLAETLVSSGFLPKAVDKPAKALAIILAGQEIGMPPMTSLRSFHVIEGKPCLSANAMFERFKARGGRAEWLESSDSGAKLRLIAPNGDEHIESFTKAQAQLAGLVGKDNWKKYPTSMYRSRCMAMGLRALGESEGMYDPDELGAATSPDGAVYEPPPSKEAHPFPKERTAGKKAALATTLSRPADEIGERADEHGVVEQYVKVTKAQLAEIHIYRDALRKAGHLPDDKADWESRLTKLFKRKSSADLSKAEASVLIDTLTKLSDYYNHQKNAKAQRQETRLENMQAEEVANVEHAMGVPSVENTNEGETDGTAP